LCDASFEAVGNKRNYHVISSCYWDILRNSYLKYIKKQVKRNRPIILLVHPHLIGRVAKNFFNPIFREIKKLKIPNYTFEQFAKWWKWRAKIKIFYRKDKNQVIIQANKYPVLVEIIYKGKKNIKKINKTTIINLKKLKK